MLDLRREGHLQRSCRARQGAETIARPGRRCRKLINGHLVGRRLPDFGKPHFQECVKFRQRVPKSSAERLFQEFEDVFSRNSSDIGHTTVTQHRIDTADHPPIKQHPRRLPFAKQEEVGTLLREMQENDIIEPSSSPWASPIVLVRKKDGSTRFLRGLSKT
ncbi:retrovirus-related Pol polyprotein from transposon 412 [Trichonephila clavipes]|nr:retrovirus-related Pol polyprotein from transposon 412 [Trichonephila clavipes]